MKKYLTKRNIIILVISLLLIGVIIFFLLKKDNNNNLIGENDNTIKNVIPEEVQDLYDTISNISCIGTNTFTLEDNTILDTTNMDNNVLLSIIFKKMELDNKISDTINLEEFNKYKKTIYGNSFKELEINNYIYNGYKYNINNNSITREITDSVCGLKYISELFGYSYNNDNLLVYVNVGYIKENSFYNVKDELLGVYTSKNESKLLDKSTTYIYTYKKYSNSYYLVSVENCLKEYKK